MDSVDPVAFFAEVDLQESLVLRFLVVPDRQTCDLVFDYAAEAVSAYFAERLFGIDEYTTPKGMRDLRHLRFTSVVSCSCEGLNLQGTFKAWRDYERKVLKPPTCITGVSFDTDSKDYSLELWLGRWGKHTISFKGLFAAQRLGRGETIGPNQWRYIDLATGKPFDLFDPFELNEARAK